MDDDASPDDDEHTGLALLLRHNIEVVTRELSQAEAGTGAPLSALVAARTVAEVIEDVTHVLVSQARHDGHTWAEIGQLLRISRQAAQQRFAGGTMETTPPEHAELTRRSSEIVEHMRNGEWEAVTGDWDAKMGPDQLAEVWDQLRSQAGPLQTVGRPSIVRKGPYRSADVPLAFEQGPMKARVTFNPDDTVGGLWILLPDAD